MKLLTDVEIESLASRPGVRRIAVENFLGSADLTFGLMGNKVNFMQDARAYGWNTATKAAIAKGLRTMFGG